MNSELKSTMKKTILLGINAVLFVTTLIIIIFELSMGAGEGQVGDLVDTGIFKAFTIDSNILMGLIGLFYLVFQVREKFFFKKIPHFANVIYLMGATSVFLTFLTVVVFLAPTNGVAYGFDHALTFFSDDMFFFHFFNPIIATVGFFLLEDEKEYKLKENLIAIIPMVVYSIVYLICVVSGAWSDFYGFTFGGHLWLSPIVLVIMYAVTFAIAFGMRKIKKKIYKK